MYSHYMGHIPKFDKYIPSIQVKKFFFQMCPINVFILHGTHYFI